MRDADRAERSAPVMSGHVRIARFVTPGPSAAGSGLADLRWGVVEGAAGADADALTVAAIADHPFGAISFTGERWALADVRLLPPILPSKVVAIGKNYADHVREMGGDAPPDTPVIFLKPSTSVCGPGDPIRLPAEAGQVDHEAELAVVIGRPLRRVSRDEALDGVLGYTCANDVTDRTMQRSDGQWARAKGYDSYCPLGPWIETAIEPTDLRITATVNGRPRQDGRTSQLVRDVPTLLEFMSAVMTLLPGDVILTGTPAGVGPIVDGDTVTVEIEGIGALSNPVRPA
jgi:2-keto-4-pentenoate hydratase/2-oxohepta-3-ene-1,7-dioic acid hydratase in catechol pathway